MNATKTCFQCKVTKLVTDFFVAKKSKDGRYWQCKACYKAQRQTPEYLEKQRQWYRNARERNREHFRELERDRKKRDPLSVKKHADNRDPVKEKARQDLRNAVYAGKIAKPSACELCGFICVPHGHHHDYSKPFDVQWFCSICHGKEHRKIAAMEATHE